MENGMNDTPMALYTLRKYLEDTNADQEVLEAFHQVLNEYTQLIRLATMAHDGILENNACSAPKAVS